MTSMTKVESLKLSYIFWSYRIIFRFLYNKRRLFVCTLRITVCSKSSHNVFGIMLILISYLGTTQRHITSFKSFVLQFKKIVSYSVHPRVQGSG
jgi:hypothetical protein